MAAPMTQARARSILHNPEKIKVLLYDGGNSHQRRKDLRLYIRQLAHLMELTKD